MAYNQYQQMHYTALHGQQPRPKTAKKYALFEAKVMIASDLPYPVLVSKKKQMEAQGHRFLTIKPIK